MYLVTVASKKVGVLCVPRHSCQQVCVYLVIVASQKIWYVYLVIVASRFMRCVPRYSCQYR